VAQNVPVDRDHGDDVEAGIFAEVNITPLTDVVLVLLIIFMVASSAMVEAARRGQLEVNLPEAGSGSETGTDQNVRVLSILADGRMVFDETVMDDEELLAALRAAHAKSAAASIIIEADGEIAHRRVVHVMEAVRRAGFANVSIAVSEGEKED